MPVRNATAARSQTDASVQARVAALNWAGVEAALDAQGCATTGPLLTPQECAAVAQTYPSDQAFRSRVIMARHGFGRGEYKYFAYPLPDLVAALRQSFYPPLADIANRWTRAIGAERSYPPDHAAYLAQCHAAGQCRPTPLLLQYQTDDYNCLH